MSPSERSLHISISQLPSPERVSEALQLVTHVARDGGYLSIEPNRLAPTQWRGVCKLEGITHISMGATVEDVVHDLADRTGAI